MKNGKESNPYNIMEETGENNKVFVNRYDGVFQNAVAIFIEYEDVIKSFQFWILLLLQKSSALKEIFDLSEIENLTDLGDLYYWYLKRKEQNIFYCLPVKTDAYEKYFGSDKDNFKNFAIDFLAEQRESMPELVSKGSPLGFVNVLQSLLTNHMVQHVYIYTGDYLSKVIEEDMKDLFPGKSFRYVSGNIVDVLKDKEITSNSTFVFSDLTKVLALKEADKLNMSSILIAGHYSYNFKEDDKEPIIDIEKLMDECVFKLDFFENIV